MLRKKFKEIFFNQKGQAIFEMVLFLPFVIFLYTIYYTVGNSINGSINQQKAVRGYFYRLVKGNSYVVSLTDLHALSGLKQVGFNAVGWRAKKNGENAVAPCFKFSSILKNKSNEDCNNDSVDQDKPDASQFIRLFTFYGVCGPAYDAIATSYEINPAKQANQESCTNQQ